MENHQYGLTSAESIRNFLEFWSNFQIGFDETRELIKDDQALIYADSTFGFSWSHLYELPVKEHFGKTLAPILSDSNFLKIFQGLASSKDQIAHIPLMCDQVDAYFDTLDAPTKEEAQEFIPHIAALFGLHLSSYFSLKCVFYYGCFLNELIAKARDGDDKSLFNAIRLDPTVVGCQTAVLRISKAAFLQDHGFFKKLKAAICGKLSKREQANYQKMRLVLEILYEAKSDRLDDDQLHHLFVKALKLYSWNEREGAILKLYVSSLIPT